MPCAYIIFSPAMNKFYIGASFENATQRLEKHNFASYGSHLTSAANDLPLKLVFPCASFSLVRKIELYIMKMKSRKFIEMLIASPDEVQILIDKCSATDSPDLSGLWLVRAQVGPLILTQ